MTGHRDPDPGWDHGGPSPGIFLPPVLDASTTVNPFPPAELLTFLGSRMLSARSYPDPYSEEARAALALRYSLSPDRIVTGGGATLLLYALLRDPSLRRVILPQPVFSEFGRAALVSGVPVMGVPPGLFLPVERGGRDPLFRTCRWGIDPGSMESLRPAPGDLAVLVNPVNPTGQEFDRETLRELGRGLFASGARLLVDESFQDFIGNRSSLLPEAGREESGVVVLRSMTKISGLPGIRAGFLAGPPDLVARIRDSLGPWSTGTLEKDLLVWCSGRMEPEEFGWREERKRALLEDLKGLGIPFVRGAGPFVLISPGFRDPDEGESLWRRLMGRGIQVRLAKGFGPPEGGRYLRLGFEAFTKRAELMSALRSAFQDRPPIPEEGR